MSRWIGLLAWAWIAIGGNLAMALEKPKFRILEKSGEFELREYAAYIVAETWVDVPNLEKASNEGFRRLGGYIFGANRGSQKIDMTAPVVAQAVTQTPAKIAMTAPVVTEKGPSGYRVAFMMPPAFTLETLPAPTDARIKFRSIATRRVASVRFSGSWNEQKFKFQEERLLGWILAKGWQKASAPYSARYNPPFWPSFLRRNEVQCEVLAPQIVTSTDLPWSD